MVARAPKVAANAPKPPTEAIPTTPRPLWLLERPIPLRSPPRELLAGPERIESGWWDGADLRRDFYLARLADGAHAWISAAAGERDGFMLEGFAG
jgi:protein ImuB